MAMVRRFNDTITRFWNTAAPFYDQQILQRLVYRPAQDQVISFLREHGSHRVADIACGTGILADRIEREIDGAEVYGVDMSQGMLAQARARSTKVQWLQGPAEQLPLDDNTIDAVVATAAFHFFDQPAALAEFHRVLRSKGVAMASTIGTTQLGRLGQFIAGKCNPAANPSPTAMRELFETAGFFDVTQHRVKRRTTPRYVLELVTVGIKP